MENNINTFSEEDWEKICLRCGQCCHKKLQTKHIFIVDPNSTCQHLKNGSCDIYENRLSPGKCIHVKDTLEIDNMLPTSCPYTQFKAGYKGFVMPDQETFDYILLLCLIIEDEEEKLGRDLTNEEIRQLEITQEKIDAAYKKT